MGANTDAYISDFAKRYVSQGFEQGLEQGLKKAFEQARAAARMQGRAEGHAEALLVVLESRGFAATDEARERVRERSNAGQLGAWISRAVTAESLDAVFE